MSEIEIPDVTVFVLFCQTGVLGAELSRDAAVEARDSWREDGLNPSWREFTLPVPESVRCQVLEAQVEDVARKLSDAMHGPQFWDEWPEETMERFRDHAREALGLTSEGEGS